MGGASGGGLWFGACWALAVVCVLNECTPAARTQEKGHELISFPTLRNHPAGHELLLKFRRWYRSSAFFDANGHVTGCHTVGSVNNTEPMHFDKFTGRAALQRVRLRQEEPPRRRLGLAQHCLLPSTPRTARC